MQAKLRREAINQRKRANKAEMDFDRLQKVNEHKALDMRAMKNALKSRDQELHEAQQRIKDLEEALARYMDRRLATVVRCVM
jgi:predicted  nucleic acid-binding Zn-ribbon protein